jgi:phage FluMu protein Com
MQKINYSIKESLKEHRCNNLFRGKKCNHLFFKGEIKFVEIKCNKCNMLSIIK